MLRDLDSQGRGSLRAGQATEGTVRGSGGAGLCLPSRGHSAKPRPRVRGAESWGPPPLDSPTEAWLTDGEVWRSCKVSSPWPLDRQSQLQTCRPLNPSPQAGVGGSALSAGSRAAEPRSLVGGRVRKLCPSLGRAPSFPGSSWPCTPRPPACIGAEEGRFISPPDPHESLRDKGQADGIGFQPPQHPEPEPTPVHREARPALLPWGHAELSRWQPWRRGDREMGRPRARWGRHRWTGMRNTEGGPVALLGTVPGHHPWAQIRPWPCQTQGQGQVTVQSLIRASEHSSPPQSQQLLPGVHHPAGWGVPMQEKRAPPPRTAPRAGPPGRCLPGPAGGSFPPPPSSTSTCALAPPASLAGTPGLVLLAPPPLCELGAPPGGRGHDRIM